MEGAEHGGATHGSSHKKRSTSDKTHKPSVKPKKPVISESDSDEDYPPPVKKPAPPIVNHTPERKPTAAELKAVVHSPVAVPSKKKKAGSKRTKSEVKEESPESEGYEPEEDEFKPKKPRKSVETKSKSKNKVAGKASAKVSVKKEKPEKEKAASSKTPPTKATPGRKKKEEEKKEVWKWWEEEPHPDGVKWLTLEHKGPYFAPPYEPLPPNVNFLYKGAVMKLSEQAEEAATFYAKMLDHDYTTRDVFRNNFFADWRKEMTSEEARKITDLKHCDFTQIHQYFVERSEQRKAMSKEEKLKVKEENEKILAEYGWAIIDGHRERIGNFKTEPPGLFRGRGDHPKQGKIKRRIQPEDVQINIGKGCPVPEAPVGHKWKSVQHDNKVTWLASWVENIQGQIKYVMLNPTSRLKGEKDWAKYEVARKLKSHVEKIREQYMADWKSREMRVRQRSVAMYFMDKLALRAGNEKDPDEAADTVGCCSLRVEHIKLHDELDGEKDVVEFDFLGKDSIRYYNRVCIEHQVFKNLKLFSENKQPEDELFDRLTTGILNKHLSELMPGLTAKVFRTYNASITLQEQLEDLTQSDATIPEKLLGYNRANRAVAILCNHQRAPPKTFDQQMSNLQGKIQAKEQTLLELKKELKGLRKELKSAKGDVKLTKRVETKKKQVDRTEDQLKKLELQATDKQENKEIALGTSKLNYLDPRISVSWCKKMDVPIEKVYNRSQRDKFSWAIDMADETFVF